MATNPDGMHPIHIPQSFRLFRIILALLVAAISLVPEKTLASATGPSGLPLPRYVSLKSARANMRIGPGRDYRVKWLYLRPGLPMEVIQEYGNWRKVRDPEGNEGWILHSLLSGERTAIVAPWNNPESVIVMRKEPLAEGPVAARLEPGVIASVRECAGDWCRLSTRGIRGFVDRRELWGVYPDEDF
jgi:SH3-like domain-containing protein